MKTTTEETVTTVKRTTRYTCSRCGKPCGYDEKRGWYDVLEAEIEARVSIKREEGSQYPEGRYTKTIVIDSCFACFNKQALPALEAAGFSTRDEESNGD